MARLVGLVLRCERLPKDGSIRQQDFCDVPRRHAARSFADDVYRVYFDLFFVQIVHNTFSIIDGLTEGFVTANPMKITGWILYGLLSVLVLFIFIRFIASWFVFTRKTLLGFVMKVTDPIMLPVQRLIPPIGMFDISAMIVLLLISFLQSMVLKIFVVG